MENVLIFRLFRLFFTQNAKMPLFPLLDHLEPSGAPPPLGAVWETAGRGLGDGWGDGWETAGRGLEGVWETSGSRLGEVWETSGPTQVAGAGDGAPK